MSCESGLSLTCRPSCLAWSRTSSLVISPTGRVIVESGIFEPAVIVAPVGLLKIKTPYLDLGDWFAWGCLIYVSVCLFIVIVKSISKKRRS